MIDGDTVQWIPTVSGVPQRSVVSTVLFILRNLLLLLKNIGNARPGEGD